MKFTPVLGLTACLVASHWAATAVAQVTGTAPGCCGLPPIHDSPQKSMVGTAVNSTSSSIYFTGYKGNVSEVYYPTVDTLATANMEFLVGDTAKTFVDEEKLQSWTVTQPDPKSMRWQATTSNTGHNWQITKMIFCRSVEQHARSADHPSVTERQDGRRFQSLPSVQTLSEECCGGQQWLDGRLRWQYLPGGQQQRRHRILRLPRFARLDRRERRHHGVERLLRGE